MERKKGIRLKMALVPLAAALLLLALFPAEGFALTSAQICAAPANADYDSDGFSDAEECNGLLAGQNGAALSWPGYLSAPVVGKTPLDPATKDLFVILVRATDLGGEASHIPANPLEYVSNTKELGGLGLTTHMLAFDAVGPDRSITYNVVSGVNVPRQKAVRVTENLDVSYPDTLGSANYGTPNDIDGSLVFTQRIINFVNDVCAGASECKDASGALDAAAVIERHIKHTIAHEVGHLVSLAVEYNSRFGGYHYRSGTKVVMEQFPKYTKKGGKVTFYLTDTYALPDQDGLLLW